MLKINKSIQVAASRSDAFTVFTRNIGRWWPPGTQEVPGPTACIEPFVGGRWYEKAVDRQVCIWGHVLDWAPFHGLTLSWKIGTDGEFDAGLHTEVEVLFKTLSPRTASVSLEHRLLERYGDKALAQRAELGSSTGWIGVLEHFARHCDTMGLSHQETADIPYAPYPGEPGRKQGYGQSPSSDSAASWNRKLSTWPRATR